MSRDFDRVYADGGRSSVPPERLVRALVLQLLYSIRSERLLMEPRTGLPVDIEVTEANGFQQPVRAGRARVALVSRGRR